MPSSFAGAKKSRRRTINDINMVPFIDVMLVLLIIFMVTAPMMAPGTINVPTVGRASDGRPPVSVASVNIDKSGGLEWTADGQSRAITLDELGDVAATWQGQQGEDSGIGIAADKTVQYEEVVKVLDALKRAEVKRVGLTVNINQGG